MPYDPNAEDRHHREPDSRASSGRGRTGEDPDVLRDLIQQARGVPLDVQHITGTEIKALKTTSQKAHATNVSMTRMVNRFLGDLFGGIAGLFSGPQKKKAGMCEMYGHVRPTAGWTGPFPMCADCGAQITSQDELRGSTAKSARH